MRNTGFKIFSFLLIGLVSTSCSSENSNGYPLYDISGELSWNSSPAADGTGMILQSGGEHYGVPGTKEDYAGYFSEEERVISVKADIFVTGDTVMRGWGAKFPEIEIINMERTK